MFGTDTNKRHIIMILNLFLSENYKYNAKKIILTHMNHLTILIIVKIITIYHVVQPYNRVI